MYLLGTQALLTAATGSNPRLAPWLDTVGLRTIHLSVISYGRALHELEQLPPSGPRSTCLRNLETLSAMVRDQGQLLPVDDSIARAWAELLPMHLEATQLLGHNVDLDDDNRIVVATALRLTLTLVEPSQPYHAAVPGLAVQTY